MSLDRDLATTGKASAPDLTMVPARPQIEPRELTTGGPVLLENSAEVGWKHTLGWEDRPERRGGPCFVVIKATFTGSFRVIERFPLTDAGWSRAWKALVKLDRDGAVKVLEALADRAGAAARKAELAEVTARSIGVIAGAIYTPGTGELPGIARGSRVDVRFLPDRVVFLSSAIAPRVLARFSYLDVVTVEVGGPGRVQRWTPGQQLAFGFLGNDAEILARTATRIKTVVRFHTTMCELFVVVSHTEPDVLRMQLSPALWAIREAREAAGQPEPDSVPPAEAPEVPEPPEASEAEATPDTPASIVDQLAKLASLLESGLLTREEFDRLKAGLLEGS
jgi:hypothetical protein